MPEPEVSCEVSEVPHEERMLSEMLPDKLPIPDEVLSKKPETVNTFVFTNVHNVTKFGVLNYSN